LCPGCVKDARSDLRGQKDWRDLMHEKVGEIKAQIIERDGEVWMVKECPIHGKYEDMMAIDASSQWIEQNFPAATFRRTMTRTCTSCSSTVRYGRGPSSR